MATNEGTAPGLPEQFGRYRVLRKLGEGGMGAVYLVMNTELQREEALKAPSFGEDDAADRRERFLREARAAAKLDHPNICAVYDVGELDGVLYMTMRYLKGRPLSDYSGAPQPMRKSAEVATKLAQALAYAHDRGVIHRDVKPGNVMMVATIGPVLMDFGLAKQTRQADQALTHAGVLLGTPTYMPPEQVRGDAAVGPAADVYSLGVILFELLTGRPPFEGQTAEVLGQVLYKEAPAALELRPGLSPLLDAVCRKALAKACDARHPTMRAFLAELVEYLKAAPAPEGGEVLTPVRSGTKGSESAVRSGAARPSAAPRSKAPAAPSQIGSKAPAAPARPAETRGGGPRATVTAPAGGRKGGALAWVLGGALVLMLVFDLILAAVCLIG